MHFKLETSGIIRRQAWARRPLQQRCDRDFSTIKDCIRYLGATSNAPRMRSDVLSRFIDAMPLGESLKTSEIAKRANLTPKAAANALYRAMENGYDIERVNHGTKPARYVRNK